MSYYPEPEVKSEQYQTCQIMLLKELKDVTCADTSTSAAKSLLNASKAKVGELEISKFFNAPNNVNSLNAQAYDLDIDKLKTVLIKLEELTDIVALKVVKDSKFNKLNTKVNSLQNTIPNATTFIHINQSNTDNKGCKKIRDLYKKTPDVRDFITTTILNINIGEVESNIKNTIRIVNASILYAKINEVEIKIPDVSGLVKKTDYNTQISNVPGKYFTAYDCNKFTK